MRKGYKRRYIRLSKNQKQTKFLLIVFVILTLFTTLGYSLYRETITRTLSLSINRPVFTIALNNQSADTGHGGTSTIYVKYLTGWYLDSALTNQMTTSTNGITIPERTGYVFRGYFTGTNGNGSKIIDTNGKVVSGVSTTVFSNNGTLYAYWIRVNADNLSYDNTNTGVNCSDSQCMIDLIKGLIS